MTIFLLVILSSAALAVCTALKPIYLQNTIDACSALDSSAVLTYFIIYICSIIGILLFETIRQLSIGKYRVNKTASLKRHLINRIVKMQLRDFQVERGQNYLTILNQEIDMLVENYYMQSLDFAYSVLVLATSIAALIYINYILAFLILISTFLPILVSTLQGKKMQFRTNVYTNSLEKLNVMIGNLISGYPTLKVNRAEGRFGNVLETSNQETAQAKFKETKTRTFVNMLIGTLAYAGEILLIGVSIILITRGHLTIGALVASLQLSEMLAIPTNSIAYQLNDMNSVKGIKNKISDLLRNEELCDEQYIECPTIKSIEFKDVSFSYKDKCILKNVSICFEAGKKYLIIGENGSGKSTLFKLISKFETGYEGQILVNGIDLKEIGTSFFDQVGIILQNTFLMNDTLLNNITLYSDYTLDDTEKVLKSMGMTEFLATHDLHSEYQDTKDNISGGEKQKIALARILLQKKNFILMDEATSAIDPESSLQIEEELLHNDDMTVINIEHKIIPQLVPLYDRILEVKDFTITTIYYGEDENL
ncbi:ATP-binding cassette domain-containing protein [Sporanaerobacter acetigenes]|uniref:ABC-type multidrug transport system, ATPase and permease component n=1 Tax=Sporanaerobacter acetigenes DSM 13106 TaxID=1123281 RepID=A0A1M5WTQ1_9FIRM|nr:ABC transporter ATP-binding protein [Sporanaerobacter acetigenes]SHH90494.1 ABC-type multidrug transport system, ATPase and permease component [Sporanaerobacter acetigenes DSM 13106]